MAEVKISALTAATGLTDDDVLIVNDGATTKKITAANALSATLRGAIPVDGAIGDSAASYDNTNSAKYRHWAQMFSGEVPTSLCQVGWMLGGITYLRQLTDCDSLSYRTATAKSSGTAYFVAYALDADLLPTGAPVWSHELASVTTTGSITETALTPFSFDSDWYFLGVWNPSDGGGTYGFRSLMQVVPGGTPFDPNEPDEASLYSNLGGSGAPPTLAGTETWNPLPYGFPAIGVLDSTT